MGQEPHQQECRNSPGVTSWTCPGCYADIDQSEADNCFEDGSYIQHKCSECGADLELFIDLEPVYGARLSQVEAA